MYLKLTFVLYRIISIAVERSLPNFGEGIHDILASLDDIEKSVADIKSNTQEHSKKAEHWHTEKKMGKELIYYRYSHFSLLTVG